MFKPLQFGKYYLTERIAIGGMAEIYKAKLYGVSGFEKAMVVKQILPQYARNAEFIKMFIDEAKISVSLSHGNIIPVYELGRIDGVYYIAMEFVDGKNLGEIFEVAESRGMPLSVEHAIFIAIEICKGLDYAHRRADDEGQPLGVVHRDLSPSNVLVTRGGEIKVADFGIAKATDKLGVTDVGVIKGSHGYMSPEQVMGQEVDHRTDIFSTGILLHQMLTGRPLFDGSNADVVGRIKEAIVTLPSMISPNVPVELDPVVLQALAKAPSDRFQDANELQLALSRLLFSVGAGATSGTLADYVQQLFPRSETPVSEEIVVDGQPPPGFESGQASVVDDDEDVTIAARAVANATHSYAVRDDLAQLYDDEIAKAPHTTAPGVSKKGKTLNLPALDDEEEATTVGKPAVLPRRDSAPPAPPSDLDDDELEDQPTMVSAAIRPSRSSLARPEVPELKIKSTSPREPKLDDSMSSFAQALSAGRDVKRESPAYGREPVTGPTPRSEPVDIFADPLTGPQRKSNEADLLSALSGGRAAGADLQSTRQHTPPSEMLDASRRGDPVTADTAAVLSMDDKPADGSDLPDPAKDPHVVLAPSKKRGPRSDDSVMALLVAPGSNTGQEQAMEQPDVGLLGRSPRVDDSAPVDPLATTAAQAPSTRERRRRPSSGVFSSTMQLLVQGLEDEPEEQLPRSIKPTIIGWLVILLLVGAAGFFVIYKKTNWLGGKPRKSGGDLLKLGDIKGGKDTKDTAPAKKKGTITITAQPASALVFLHVGDSPVKRHFDGTKTYLLRAEREGYGTVHKLVEPNKLNAKQLTLTLPPRGAGQKSALPTSLPTPGGASGKTVQLTIATEPPSASVWLLVGKGKAELVDVEAKRHYFKVLAQGHQTSFVSISSSRFDKGSKVQESISLTAKAGVDGGTAKAASPDAGVKKASAPDAATKPDKTPVKVAGKQPAAKKATTKRKRRKRRKRRRRKKKKKKKPGLQTPSWAR
jgi:serine/threonine protein kinase